MRTELAATGGVLMCASGYFTKKKGCLKSISVVLSPPKFQIPVNYPSFLHYVGGKSSMKWTSTCRPVRLFLSCLHWPIDCSNALALTLTITPTLSFTLTHTDQVCTCSHSNFTLIIHPSIHPSINQCIHPATVSLYSSITMNCNIYTYIYIFIHAKCTHPALSIHRPYTDHEIIHYSHIHTYMHAYTHTHTHTHTHTFMHPWIHPPHGCHHPCPFTHPFVHLTCIRVLIYFPYIHVQHRHQPVMSLSAHPSALHASIHVSPIHHVPVHHPFTHSIHPTLTHPFINPSIIYATHYLCHPCIHNLYDNMS